MPPPRGNRREARVETRRIGSLAVSVLGLGCTNFGKRTDEAQSAAIVRAALEEGITFFDVADTYGYTLGEEYLGRALGRQRDEVVLATKFGQAIDDVRRGASRDYVRRAVEDSLRRLRTDRIDLYQLHLPDPEVPIAETLEALDALVRAGKVREIGCSNFDAAQLLQADAAARAASPPRARFVSVQNEYSLLQREPERDVLATCARLGIAFIPYYPLSAGLLTGKFRRGLPPPPGTRVGTGSASGRLTAEALDRVEALAAFAGTRGRTLLELAISWLLTRPVASVIAGAMTPGQLRANVAAAGWRLSSAELAAVDAIAPPPGREGGADPLARAGDAG